MSRYQKYWLIAVLICFGAGLRLLPHPANFAPITAVALFGGALLPKKYAAFVPLAAMIMSDLIIGLHSLIPVTWGCYLLIALASNRYWSAGRWQRNVSMVVGSSLFFFVVTNFAVWLWGGLYPATFAGLERCFVLALPFFRNTLLSDLFYSGVLFGLYALAARAGDHLTQKSGSTA